MALDLAIARSPSKTAPSNRPAGQLRLVLLPGFELLCDGQPVPLPHNAQRVLAFLALHDWALQRSFVAGSLWEDVSDDRANANLRSALWRVGSCGQGVVDATRQQLRLAMAVSIDFREAVAAARRLVDRSKGCVESDLEGHGLAGDLLCDWYDEWVLVERERFRQIRLHALEALSERLVELGRFAEAVETGLTAVSAEPLRETAQRVLIGAYLAEGNRREAVRQYEHYRQLLWDELAVAPSPSLRDVLTA